MSGAVRITTICLLPEKIYNDKYRGNSTFEIPVAEFDSKLEVTADTVAMSTPHEIDYTLQFDSSTIQEAE